MSLFLKSEEVPVKDELDFEILEFRFAELFRTLR